MIRYADDIVVLCKSKEIQHEVHEQIREWMKRAGLTLHPEKTHEVDMSIPQNSFDFLGYCFKLSNGHKLVRLVRDKSLTKLKDKVRKVTRRNNPHSMNKIILEDLNPMLIGWFNYFKHIHRSELSTLDGWIRMRLRSILWKRRGGKGRGRGRDNHRWPNSYFKELGLCFLADKRAEVISLQRNGATH